MSQQPFDPRLYRHKDVIYLAIPGYQGICTVWTWTGKKYVRRTIGLQYYAYKKINADQKSKCFETFQQAKQWRECAELIVDETPESEMTFAEAKKRFFEHCKGRVQITTYEGYESNAKHLAFFDPLPVKQINAKTIDAWLIAIKKPEYLAAQNRSRVTYESELSMLGYILKDYAEYEDDEYQVPIRARHRRDGIVDLEKYQLSKDRNKRKFIPRTDFEKFLVVMAQRAMPKPDLTVFAVLAEFQLGGGTRVGETCAVPFEDVLDWNTGAVSISRNVQWSRKKGRPTRISPLTKTGESRTVFLSARALDALKKWKLMCGRSRGLIFSYDGFTPLPYRCVQHHYDAAFKSLGMTWKSTHILRHSYSTDFLEKTGNKVALQGQLGHRTSRQTDHYAKVTTTAQYAGVTAYNESLRGPNVVDLHPISRTENPDRLGEAGITQLDQSVESKKPRNHYDYEA